MLKRFLLLFSFLCFTLTLCAQIKTAPQGIIKGIVRDTVHNYVLKSATVSIYKPDNTIINYQLSNNYGEFKFANIPIDQPLRIDVSNVGYQTLRKNITIPKGETLLDLKTLILSPQDITLKEVTISIPPITYNNDTLEINAIAFKLDTNATVEDLLKKVPNITVWGDGLITVNGKEVKRLLVNGKDFFGGDNKIALQNIPKNALEKIQIFNTADRNKPLDSNLVANLKLKKGKDRNYFGKIGIGYGTDNHYQFDGNINLNTQKLQLAIIGASNDVNKIPNDVNTLIRNSTYKGVGTSVEYQSDFRQEGLNKGNVIGTQMTYNLMPESKDWNNKKSIDASYYFKHLNSINERATQTTTALADNNQLLSNDSSNNNTNNNSHHFNSGYNYHRRNHHLDIRQSLSLEDGSTDNVNLRNARNNAGQLTSTNNATTHGNFNNKNFSFNADYSYINYNNWESRFKSLNAGYNVSSDDVIDDRIEITSFRDLISSDNDLDIKRHYQTQSKRLRQEVYLGFPNLKSLLFKNAQLAYFNLEINSRLKLNNNKDNNVVEDFNNNAYQQNANLTNRTQTDQTEYLPSIILSKQFNKNLSNRYYKNLELRLFAAQQFINQNNNSDKAFQNIKRSYRNFLPGFAINSYNQQIGNYYQSFSFSFGTNIRIPTLQQLAPLEDNNNQYDIQRGNVNLKEEVDRSLNLSFSHNNMKSKNTLNFYLSSAIGQVSNAIVDSTFINQQNQRDVFLTNADGGKYARFSGNIRKSIKFKNSELQLSYQTSGNISKRPTYTNNIFNFSDNLNFDNAISTFFGYKDKLGLEAKQSLQNSSSKQRRLNSQFSNVMLSSNLSANYNFTKKLSLSSNISYNNNNPSVGQSVNFTIWNANVTYRFTKGNNAEIKLSALDILHQNQSINNFAITNGFSTSTRNVLQQYFMATISYYPRKFGFNDKANSQ